MFQKLVIAGIALLTAACVPIPPEPPASASVSAPTETLAKEYESADCPGGYIDLLPGQSAHDPPLSSLPDYVDIVRVESSLDGETLTAIFHLRGIPEKLEFSRKGVDDLVMEYMWTIGIDIDNDGGPEYERTDFTLSAFHSPKGSRRIRLPLFAHSRTQLKSICGKTGIFPKRTGVSCGKCGPPFPNCRFLTRKARLR